MLGAALALTLTKAANEPIKPQMFEADLVLMNISDNLGKPRSYDLSESAASTQLAFETETINGCVPMLELSTFKGMLSIKKTEYRFKVGEGIRKMQSRRSTLVNTTSQASDSIRMDFFDFGMTAALTGTNYARYPLALTSSGQIRAQETGAFNHYRDVLMVISTENPADTQSLLKEKLPGFTGLILYTKPLDPLQVPSKGPFMHFPEDRRVTVYRIGFNHSGWHARVMSSITGLIPQKSQLDGG